ncbi:MAG: hypothetical protein HY778_10610 [Betaproteobacteria bacterium]|nr:hypothetical protein [Betaproteobacteria bacterium]
MTLRTSVPAHPLLRRPLLVPLAFGVVMVAVAVAGWWSLAEPALPEPVAAPAGCDLHARACRARLPGGGSVELEIAPRPIALVTPLQVTVRVQETGARSVEVDFAGEWMNMGSNRIRLAAAGEGHYLGETTLPVCITGRMAWKATVILRRWGGDAAAVFRFESGE